MQAHRLSIAQTQPHPKPSRISASNADLTVEIRSGLSSCPSTPAIGGRRVAMREVRPGLQTVSPASAPPRSCDHHRTVPPRPWSKVTSRFDGLAWDTPKIWVLVGR